MGNFGFREIENTTIYELSSDLSVASNDLLLMVRPNYKKGKSIDKDYPYYSFKSTVEQLSSQIEDTMLRKNEEVSGTWKFFNAPLVQNYKLSGNISKKHAATYWYLESIYNKCLKAIYSLSNYIFNEDHPRIPSYVGMIVPSSLGTEAEIRKIYGGNSWELTCKNRYLVGVGTRTNEYSFDSKHGHDTVTLKYNQSPVTNHYHSISVSDTQTFKTANWTLPVIVPAKYDHRKHRKWVDYAVAVSTVGALALVGWFFPVTAAIIAAASAAIKLVNLAIDYTTQKWGAKWGNFARYAFAAVRGPAGVIDEAILQKVFGTSQWDILKKLDPADNIKKLADHIIKHNTEMSEDELKKWGIGTQYGMAAGALAKALWQSMSDTLERAATEEAMKNAQDAARNEAFTNFANARHEYLDGINFENDLLNIPDKYMPNGGFPPPNITGQAQNITRITEQYNANVNTIIDRFSTTTTNLQNTYQPQIDNLTTQINQHLNEAAVQAAIHDLNGILANVKDSSRSITASALNNIKESFEKSIRSLNVDLNIDEDKLNSNKLYLRAETNNEEDEVEDDGSDSVDPGTTFQSFSMGSTPIGVGVGYVRGAVKSNKTENASAAIDLKPKYFGIYFWKRTS